MKNTGKILLLALSLIALPLTAEARDYQDRFERRSSPANLEWRMGEFLRHKNGYEILYRSSRQSGWRRAPGVATALGDGWHIGNNRARGGYGIYRWDGHEWDRMPGAAVRIGGNYHNPWVVNDRGVRYSWDGRDWREEGRYRNNRNRNVTRYDLRFDSGDIYLRHDTDRRRNREREQNRNRNRNNERDWDRNRDRNRNRRW